MFRVYVLAALLGGSCLGPAAAEAQTVDDLTAMGRQIAVSFDTVNGHPAQSLTGFDCVISHLCSSEEYPEEYAAAIATGLAEALDIPLESPGVEPTVCPWGPADAEGRHGLTTQFILVDLAPNSATVLVTGRCVSSRGLRPLGFVQGHVYQLRKSLDGEWAVISSELRVIS